jgi:hypothetical protein
MPKSETTEAPSTYQSKDGTNYIYVRVAMTDKKGAVPLAQLADDEIVIPPGWVYREQYRELKK